MRFLWVSFQLDALCEAPSDAHIRPILADLPVDLESTYQRILAKISASPFRNEVAKRALKWVACARRPLTLEELQEAIAFDGGDVCWRADKIPNRNFTIECCQGLVVRDEEDQSVTFAHHTVKQFLLLPGSIRETLGLRLNTASSEQRENRDLLFSLSEAERHAGAICITYLSFSDFETALAPRQPPTAFSSSHTWGSMGPKYSDCTRYPRIPL